MRVRTFLAILTVAVAQSAMALDQRCAAATPERLAACIDDCRDRPEDELRDCQRLCKEGHEAAKTACPTEPGRMAPKPDWKSKRPRLPG
jgi:hypothetical protein